MRIIETDVFENDKAHRRAVYTEKAVRTRWYAHQGMIEIQSARLSSRKLVG
jgi:hypothetical protein